MEEEEGDSRQSGTQGRPTCQEVWAWTFAAGKELGLAGQEVEAADKV